MKRFFSSKTKRKQAEEQILLNIGKINKKLEIERQKTEHEHQKNQVMSVLTRFLKIKKDTKIH